MLDFAALAAQMEAMLQVQSDWLSPESTAAAVRQICTRSDSEHDFNSIIEAARESGLLPEKWHPATFLDASASLCESHEAPPAPHPHSVLAADGSQIYPEAHNIAFCYLLHISRIGLRYSDGVDEGIDGAQLGAESHFFYDGMEDPWHAAVGGQGGPPVRELVDARRHVAELNALADLLDDAPHTSVGLCDGIFDLRLSASLAWRDFAESENTRALERLKQTGHPVAGYIAASRAIDVTTALHVLLMDYENNGRLDASTLEKMGQALERLNDVRLFDTLLQPRQRSTVFLANRNMPRRRGGEGRQNGKPARNENSQHQSCFFYLKIEDGDVARLEFPHWVAQHEPWLDLIHTVVLEQIEKGDGYPIALMEAHEHAVVRNTDRELFFQLLEELMLARGLTPKRSAKMRSKIRPLV